MIIVVKQQAGFDAEDTGIPALTLAVPGSLAGPTGPQGPPGLPAQTYVYQQPTPAAMWTITHNLGVMPAVVILDSANSLVEGDVQYWDLNTVQIEFNAAFAGTAYLI